MTASAWASPSPDPSPRLAAVPGRLEATTPSETPSPPSEGLEDEDILYGDGDDAQSFMQPAISPVATRIASPKVLAAERAAAMERLQGEASSDHTDEHGTFGPKHAHTEPISKLQPKKRTEAGHGEGSASLQSRPPQRSQTLVTRLPSPWHSGPREFVVDDLKTRKPALTGVFGSSTRHQRASSLGESALKRLSKALDSVNLPNFSTSSFFSPSHKENHAPLSPKPTSQSRAVPANAPLGQSSPRADSASQGQALDVSKDSLALQRTQSDDSALYHSLSRVSSYGDDERWTHIREQVNVRMKAIKDSWDAPTFKLPSKCNEPRFH